MPHKIGAQVLYEPATVPVVHWPVSVTTMETQSGSPWEHEVTLKDNDDAYFTLKFRTEAAVDEKFGEGPGVIMERRGDMYRVGLDTGVQVWAKDSELS